MNVVIFPCKFVWISQYATNNEAYIPIELQTYIISFRIAGNKSFYSISVADVFCLCLLFKT